ncbi:MAG: hypothetical protein QM759_01790 [Terricaulis sp.]
MRILTVLATLIVSACATAATGPDPMGMDDATFERALRAKFEAGPPLPIPNEVQDQAAGQIADAEYFSQFLNYDISYSRSARAHAQRLMADLRAHAGELSHEQFVLRVAEIAALADNGHTNVGQNSFKKNTPRIPVRTYSFADGLYVLWATPAYANLLGARIDAIDGHPIAAVRAGIRRYIGGTQAHRDSILTPMLESPALLQVAGFATEHDALTLSGVLADGQTFTQRISAERRDRSAWVSSTERTLFPAPADVGMESVMRDNDALPVYLRDRALLFTTAELPENGYYIGLSFNRDADEGPIAPFLDNALAHVRNAHPAFVVLDMRLNGGGDYTTTYAFAHQLPRAAAPAHIYVLTSPWTFSAAITTVAGLKQTGGAQVSIVGENVGDRLDFYAEGDTFQLPNAFMTVHFSNGRHVYDGPCRDTNTCYWLNYKYPVRVRTLTPDIPAPLTFAAYKAMRDPAMDAVLAAETRVGSSARRH